MKSYAVLAASLALLLSLRGTAAGQEVRGRVTGGDSGGPLLGTFVILRDSASRRWDAALTDSAGRYRLRSPQPGSYTVVAERIGYATTTSPAVLLTEGAIGYHNLTLQIQPIHLPELTSNTNKTCKAARENAREVAAVWNEARKALTVVSWANEQKLLSYEILRYSRVLEPRRQRVLREHNQEATDRLATVPWLVKDPDRMVMDGFVQRRDDTLTSFYVPGAEVLLSSSFLGSYCLVLRTDSAGSRVGLQFQPITSSNRADVNGTLWLNRRDLALQSIEYSYVQGDRRLGSGAMHYTSLPAGIWLPSFWQVTIDVRGRTGRFAQIEEGAHVMRVIASDSTDVWRTSRHIERGLTVSADSSMSSPAGAPRLPFFSAAALVGQRCAMDSDTSELIILVIDATGNARPGITVHVVTPSRGGRFRLETDANGLAVFCGLPTDRTVSVTLDAPGVDPHEVILKARPGQIMTRSFLVK